MRRFGDGDYDARDRLSSPPAADPHSIQRMLHYDADQGYEQYATPRQASGAEQGTLRRISDQCDEQAAFVHAGGIEYATPRRSTEAQQGTPRRASDHGDDQATFGHASGIEYATPRRSTEAQQGTPRRRNEIPRAPQSATPAKRNPSRSPPRGIATPSRSPVVPRQMDDAMTPPVSGTVLREIADSTPRRSSARIRAEGYSPVVRGGAHQNVSPNQARAQVTQGRPKSKMWEHFQQVGSGASKKAICKYCFVSLNNPKPGFNISTHLKNVCEQIPANIKRKLIDSSSAQTATRYVPATYVESPHCPSEPAVSSVDQATFNMMIVELVVVCALPFSILESLAFQSFIHKLAPSVRVPSRQSLTHELLENAAKVMRQRVVARINKQEFVSLVTDGWTDPNGAKIVNFMAVAPGMPSLFWSSWASGSVAHTSANLTAKVKQVVEENESMTTARVVGIVTDNASNMMGVWDRLSSIPIVGGGCAAHVLNLLMKNLFAHEVLKKVHSNCVQLSRFVRDHTGLLDTFRATLDDLRDGGARRSGLTLPVPTRWYSVFNCLENVLMNRDELFRLFTSPDYEELRQRYATKEAAREKLAYVTAIVEDGVFWTNLDVVVRLIRPIRHALGKLESDKMFASDVYSQFRALLRHELYGVRTATTDEELPTVDTSGDANGADTEAPPDPNYSTRYQPASRIVPGVLKEFFREKIQQRWNYVHTNAMAIAFFLDPRCKFKDFEGGDERKARQAIVKFALDRGLIKPSEQESFADKVFEFAEVKDEESGMGKTCPKKYWKSVKREFPVLGQIADIVFALPTSSAASERAWSIFNHIHTKAQSTVRQEGRTPRLHLHQQRSTRR